MDLGWPEILLILAIILIVFGVGRLPQVASQMGKGIREFRKAQRGDYDDNKQTKESGDQDATKAPLLAQGSAQSTSSAGPDAPATQDELAATKAKLEAAEARLRELQDTTEEARISPRS